MDSYKEATEWLFEQVPMFQNLGEKAYKPGLGTTLALAKHYGNPHKHLKAIHIAGTNGKGSTAHTLAAVLQAAGYKTGLYTSPHLVDFRERIRVDGQMADREWVTGFINAFRNNPPHGYTPTFFELTTVMAFCYFAEQGVDVAVVETGLGGRLDSTNILPAPELCIITNISLDHTSLLGHTEAEIATEKAGIIKPGVPVVVGRAHGDVRRVFQTKAQEEGAPMVFAADSPLFDVAASTPGHYRSTPWGDIEGELRGACQAENAATVLAALEILKNRFGKIDRTAVAKGFSQVCALTGLQGRWMQVPGFGHAVICDTGHNAGGWEWLGKQLGEIAARPWGTLRMVVGFVNDKDIRTILRYMPRQAEYYFTCPSVKRGRPAESTLEIARSAGLHGSAYATVAEAFHAASAASAAADTVFVGGSTFVVADFLARLN